MNSEKIALGIPILHRNGIDHIDDFIQQRGIGDDEHRVLHELRVRITCSTIQGLDEGEHLVAKHLELPQRLKILEAGPAQVVLVLVENGILDLLPEQLGLLQPVVVNIIQPFSKEQVGDLLDDGERIGDPA